MLIVTAAVNPEKGGWKTCLPYAKKRAPTMAGPAWRACGRGGKLPNMNRVNDGEAGRELTYRAEPQG
ncbi:hypothetical protein AA14362_1812 [Acetobacter cerevisiae DSM 14362]|nr:hypothetical protein AA14362_1812 [Acetobacter cerevisiae DSM 14362]